MSMIPERVTEYFNFAKARHQIYLLRRSGSLPPYTDDPVLGRYRFTNVFRELDRTTAWFRENVRKHYDGTPSVLLATILFRSFNRIETGRLLFGESGPNEMIGHRWIRGDARDDELTEALCDIQNSGLPVVTGAYTIMTPKGLTKSEGVAFYCNFFRKKAEWYDFAQTLAVWQGTSPREPTWRWLMSYPGQGSFISGQIVADLRFTYLHQNASDVMLWTPVGPGSARGLHILSDRPRDGRNLKGRPQDSALIREMKMLLEISRYESMWPQDEDHPKLELSDIQNLLCEYSKLHRIRYENGSTRSNWRPSGIPVPGYGDYR